MAPLRMIRLSRDEVMALLEADWLSDEAIRLNGELTLDELAGSTVLHNARIVLRHMAADKGVGLTATGCFKRRFVEQMVQDFTWPGFEPERVWYLNKVLNERDFMPLEFLRLLIEVAGLGRKYRGTYRTSRLARSLLDDEAAGHLNAELFNATFKDFNLAYLERAPEEERFQDQIGLSLYMIGKIADRPLSSDELVKAATLPIEPVRSDFHVSRGKRFEIRVLRFLEWFGLIEALPMAARDEWRKPKTYRKTPLYDRFLSFHLGRRPDPSAAARGPLDRLH